MRLGIEPRGLDLSVEAGIWVSRLEFGPQGWDLGPRLEFGPGGLDLGLEAEGGGDVEGEEEGGNISVYVKA